MTAARPITEPELAAELERHRPALTGLGYRLLGIVADAEDVVQEAFLRWRDVDRERVRDPRAFLVTVVSRLALDRLRSAQARRETYVGPWLPEPVVVEAGWLGGPANDAADPQVRLERWQQLSIAVLHLLERLSPAERAAYVLREAFDLGADEVAEILETTAPNVRQLQHRAEARLGADRKRFRATPAQQQRLLAGMLDAARTGDLSAVKSLLREDAVLLSDGGGLAKSARRPVLGAARVSAFVVGVQGRRFPGAETRMVLVNGQPSALLYFAGRLDSLYAVGVDADTGLIAGVYIVRNPEKLARVDAAVPRT